MYAIFAGNKNTLFSRPRGSLSRSPQVNSPTNIFGRSDDAAPTKFASRAVCLCASGTLKQGVGFC